MGKTIARVSSGGEAPAGRETLKMAEKKRVISSKAVLAKWERPSSRAC